MDSYLKNYINGAWVDSIGGKRHEVISPSTEEPCTEIMLGTKADLDAAVAAAKEAGKTWSQTTAADGSTAKVSGSEITAGNGVAIPIDKVLKKIPATSAG